MKRDKRINIINYTSDGSMAYVILTPPGDPNDEYAMFWGDWTHVDLGFYLRRTLKNAETLPCRMTPDGTRMELLTTPPYGKGMQVFYRHD